MKAKTAILAAVGLALLMAPAEARTRCGAKTFKLGDTVRAYRGNFIALCDPRGACKIATYVNDAEKRNQWTHRLAFLRDSKEAPWTVQLTSVPHQVDISEGFALGVDGKEPMRVPAEVISSPGSLNDYNLNPDLGQIVITAFGPGANVNWLYTSKDPKQEQNVWFSLKGLRSALRWIDCMQGS
jgi:invasion protein IalB